MVVMGVGQVYLCSVGVARKTRVGERGYVAGLEILGRRICFWSLGLRGLTTFDVSS